MPKVSIDLEMKRVTNDAFVSIAKECEPRLKETVIAPVEIVEIREDAEGKACVSKRADVEMLPEMPLGKGDKLCLDFGDHQVGYVTLKLKSVGSPMDAPAFFRLKFGEVAKEILEQSQDYDGWISRGWIQEEFIHIDVLPTTLVLPRRYAFRYMEITAIDTSLKWKLVVEEVSLRGVSAVDMKDVKPYETEDEMLQKIEKVSLRTLQNCMQSVFEDGPKRDRRLWIGDLRLQALANYETFKNYDLVKRCLYLFGGLTRDDGKVGACLFIEPEYIVDDTFFYDYSLFFTAILMDYYKETGDMQTLKDLWPCARRQLEIAGEVYDENHMAQMEDPMGCFVDWKEGLDKQVCMGAIYVYCLRRGMQMAEILGENQLCSFYEEEIARIGRAIEENCWDEKAGVYVSGPQRQVSYATQAWMVLAELVSREKGSRILKKVLELKPEMGMVTPYMNHHFTEALLLCGEKETAMDYMKYYWGSMIQLGADTFWELFNPENPKESPYGSSIVNSYCHAWSCTPTYLLRKYF